MQVISLTAEGAWIICNVHSSQSKTQSSAQRGLAGVLVLHKNNAVHTDWGSCLLHLFSVYGVWLHKRSKNYSVCIKIFDHIISWV